MNAMVPRHAGYLSEVNNWIGNRQDMADTTRVMAKPGLPAHGLDEFRRRNEARSGSRKRRRPTTKEPSTWLNLEVDIIAT